MDCQMPVMDGYEATSRLRRVEGDDRHTPVIALTALAMTADRARCIAAGMDDYLAKPVQVEDLIAALHRWVAAVPPTHAQPAVNTRPGLIAEAPLHPGIDTDDPRRDLDATIVDGLRELGGVSLLDELVLLFRDEVGRYLGELEHALSLGDTTELGRAAHALSGSSANLGAFRVAATAGALEHLAVSGNLDGAPALVRDLAAHSRSALEALAAETGRPTDTADITVGVDPSSPTLPRGSK
jgi:HPt (histidine-containing phosphotransfer) domain-containing protein